jgi:CDP-glycerol glycerophosphotransferase (TagB/SpsB family)
MDRDTKADDNAEHLYRYIRDNHPETRVFFVLAKSSADWDRLQKDGFNLIEFGSEDNKLALLNADHFISSHADEYLFCGLKRQWFGDLLSYKFTFLQHGVTKDDLSIWLNSKNIDCFVTATRPERDSIIQTGNYKFTNKEVVLTGFPRHDKLRLLSSESVKQIVIMPTWRNSLVGPASTPGHPREINPDFKDSGFFREWKSVLDSQTLYDLHHDAGYRIVFAPHINLTPYLTQFDLAEHIQIHDLSREAIQPLIAESSILVTDYSSLAFEAAAVRRAVVYFQFDKDEVFSGAHTYQAGYFDYQTDGFGPVCATSEGVLSEIRSLVDRRAVSAPEYARRIEETFVFQDVHACERVFSAIKALDKSSIAEDDIKHACLEHARRASENNSWTQALDAWLKYIDLEKTDLGEGYYNCAVIYRQLNDLVKADEYILLANECHYEPSNLTTERLKLLIAQQNYIEINDIFEELSRTQTISELPGKTVAVIARSFRLQQKYQQSSMLLSQITDCDEYEVLFERAEEASYSGTWVEAQKYWELALAHQTDEESLIKYAHACRMCEQPLLAHKALVKVVNPVKMVEYATERAEIEYLLNHWKVACKYWAVLDTHNQLSADTYLKYAKALRKSSDYATADYALEKSNDATDQRTLLQERALLATASRQWETAVTAWTSFIARKDLRPNRDAWLHLAQVRFSMGDRSQAQKDLERFEAFGEKNKKSEQLRTLLQTEMTA